MAVFTIGGKSVMKKKSDYRLLLQKAVRESSDAPIVGHIDLLHKHDWRKPTSEYDTTCIHEWEKLSKEDREKYGSAIAKCLEKWRECRKCGQVKHVGYSLPECADTFQQTKGRQYTGRPHPPLPELTPLSELNLDEVLGEGRR